MDFEVDVSKVKVLVRSILQTNFIQSKKHVIAGSMMLSALALLSKV